MLQFMTKEIRERIENDIKSLTFFNELKDNICDFQLNKLFREVENTFEIFSYTNEIKHRSIKIYFHADTNEYRVLKSFGLNEFCLTEFFTDNLNIFTNKLQTELEDIVKNISEFDGDQNVFVEQKQIPNWQYGEQLPKSIEKFNLFINPSKYLEVTNGSFVIINYSDFSINSDLAVYYNIFSDNFGSEARINGAPTVIYDFDSDNLKELEEKLDQNLVNQLQNIKKEVEQ